MPNVAAVLKSEIEQVARKQAKASTDTLQEADKARRAELSALRRRVAELERQVARLARAAARQAPPVKSADAQEELTPGLRWRHQGFASHRARLGLSAAQMAQLIGCSALSVYKWESGKVRPRQSQLAAIADLRKLSKSEALARLQMMA